MDIPVNDYVNSCRTCLSSTKSLESLFEETYDGEKLDKICSFISSLTILAEDELSAKICEDCKRMLIEFYKFRKMCISSDEIVRENLGKVNSIKEEIDAFSAEEESYFLEEAEATPLPVCFTDQLEIEKLMNKKDEIKYSKCPDCESEECKCSEEEIEAVPKKKIKKIAKERPSDPSHKKLRPKKHVCDICNHAVESPSKLMRHMNVHKKGGKTPLPKSSLAVTEEENVLVKKEEEEFFEFGDSSEKQKKERNKKYVCPICDLAMEAPSKLKRHLRSHMIRDLKDKTKTDDLESELNESNEEKMVLDETEQDGSRTYSCNFCTKSCVTLPDFYEHLKGHDIDVDEDSVGSLNCHICKQKFNTETALERHQIVHTDVVAQSKIIRTEPYQYTCIICSRKIDDYDQLFVHMRCHKMESENKEIQCQLCPKTFSSIKNIMRHAAVHEENATHQCIKCNRKYGMGDAFIDHMLVHQNMKPFDCKQCGKNFLKYYQLKNHLKAHTANAKPHLCQECGKSFAEADYLNRHLKRHSGEKPYQCTICPKSFTFKYSLTSHMVYHSRTKSFYCETCGGSFASNETLRKHQRIHNNDKRFKCDQCPMKFTVSSYLVRHMRTHTGEKPYQCQYCDRAYAQSNDLVKHTRIHVGQNTYKCEFAGCNAAYRLHGNLKEHLLLHYKAMKETGDPMLIPETTEMPIAND